MRDFSGSDGPNELVPLHITDEGDPTATLTLHLAGDLDCCTAQQFCNTVEQRLTGHPMILCVDLEKVAFLDAAGCQALLHCHAEAAQQCCQLLLIRPQPLVHQVLDILGLLTTFGLPAPPIPAWRRRDTRPPSAPQPFTPVTGTIEAARTVVASAHEARRRAEAICVSSRRLLGIDAQ
jgi:anti-anti-sigma factor